MKKEQDSPSPNAASGSTGFGTDDLIATLSQELKPVRPMSDGAGWLAASVAIGLTILVAAVTLKLLPFSASGLGNPMLIVAQLLFAALAMSATFATIKIARPNLGNHPQSGWIWASGLVALLPIAALGEVVWNALKSGNMPMPVSELECLAWSLVFGLLTFVTLTFWLKRGAPTDLERAGLLVGLASGATGAFVYALHCPNHGLVHIGLIHTAAIAASAVIGRFAIPPFIRW